MTISFESIAAQLGIPIWLITIALIWSLVWKGLALWKSSKLNQPIWFVILLVVNSVGILEILYIFLFSKIKLDSKPVKKINVQHKKKR